MQSLKQTPKQFVESVFIDAELRYKPNRAGRTYIVARESDNIILGSGYTAPEAWRNAAKWIRENKLQPEA